MKVVVVGAGVGGLSAAIHARLAGADVTLLEQRDRVGGKAAGISDSGFELDPGPSIIILTQIYDQLFARAGRHMEDYLVFDRLPIVTRLYFGTSREPIDIPADFNACLELLDKIAPEDRRSFEHLFAKLNAAEPHVAKSVFRHPYLSGSDLLDPHLMQFGLRFNPFQNYKQMVDRLFRSPILRAFFYGFPSYGGQSYDSKSPGSFLIPYYMLRQGVYFPRGGVRAIPLALARLAEELGVHIRLNEPVTGWRTAGNRVAGVTTPGGEYPADRVISNVDPMTFLVETPPDLEPSYSYFTCHWGLKRRIPGLAHHTLFVPEGFERGFERLYRDSAFPDPPIVYVNAVADSDPAAVPPSQDLLFAVVTSPAEVPTVDWANDLREFESQSRRVVQSFGIDWTEDDVVFRRLQSPTLFRERDGNFRGSLYGPHERHRLFGLFPPGNRHPRLENVFSCGGAVQPGAGLPMVTLSGQFAADLAMR